MKSILFLSGIALIILLASCVTNSYSIQLLSGDNIILSDTYTRHRNDQPENIIRDEIPAIFTGTSLEDVLVQARENGFTRILSIETLSSNFLGLIPINRVVIRCARDVEISSDIFYDD